MTRALLILPFALSCAAQVGDECAVNTDCGTGLFCDLSQPSGYCTNSPCDPNGCPEEAVCIEFPDQSSFCMLRCDANDDCRDNYQCVSNYGDLPFCSAAPYIAPVTASPAPPASPNATP